MKVLKICSLLLVFMLVGCSKEKSMICDINVNNTVQNYSIIGTYKIYYKNDFVNRIEKQEKYLSDDKFMIDYFNQSKELEYYNLSDNYGGVIYEIKSTDNTVMIKASINFKDFDITQMSKDGNIDRDYVINGRLTLSGIKHIYEEKGAFCN